MTTEKKQALWIAVAVFAALLSFGGWAMGGLRPSGGGSGDAVGVSSRLNNYSGHETAALANETSIRSLADRDLILRWTDFEPRLSAYSTSNSSRINHVNIDIVGPSGIQAKTPFNFVRQHIYNVDTSIRVVIVGESTSNGYGLADPSTQCWPRKLADHFNGLGLYSTVKYYQPPVYRVTFNGYSQTVNIKSGIGGRTLIVRNAAISGAAISASHTALANWTTTANWNGMIKNVEPRYDVAIINVGHNNSTQVVPDQVSDYIKVINRLKTDYPGIEILICTQDINKNVYELYSNYAATSTAEITSSGHIDLQKIVAQGDPVNYCIQPGCRFYDY